MNEFEIIEQYFLPLSGRVEGALALKDDAAIVSPKSGCELVVTKDALVEAVHFFKGDNPYNIATKLLGVNVSDLAAMGARPIAYLLAVILPRNTDAKWLEAFARGLADAAKKFGGNIKLIGGDTVSHEGPLVLTLTAIGEVAQGKALKRSGAKVGDGIYVSGTIGDSYLGLQILSGKIDFKSDYLVGRYHNPEPRVKLGQKLLGTASACIDVSDGLIADLGHICECSKVGAEIFLQDIPLSNDAKKSGANITDMITGGDDYELLFTLPDNVAAPGGTTKIGAVTAGKGVKILNADGSPVAIEASGYKHF